MLSNARRGRLARARGEHVRRPPPTVTAPAISPARFRNSRRSIPPNPGVTRRASPGDRRAVRARAGAASSRATRARRAALRSLSIALPPIAAWSAALGWNTTTGMPRRWRRRTSCCEPEPEVRGASADSSVISDALRDVDIGDDTSTRSRSSLRSDVGVGRGVDAAVDVALAVDLDRLEVAGDGGRRRDGGGDVGRPARPRGRTRRGARRPCGPCRSRAGPRASPAPVIARERAGPALGRDAPGRERDAEHGFGPDLERPGDGAGDEPGVRRLRPVPRADRRGPVPGRSEPADELGARVAQRLGRRASPRGRGR